MKGDEFGTTYLQATPPKQRCTKGHEFESGFLWIGKRGWCLTCLEELLLRMDIGQPAIEEAPTAQDKLCPG